jgi:long-chain acyl-CoA synthetase
MTTRDPQAAGSPAAQAAPDIDQLPPSIGRQLSDAVERFEEEDRVALRYRDPDHDAWEGFSWAELLEKVQHVAAGLIDLGIGRGDRVALLSNSRWEWAVTDLATLSIGAITVPIYQSNTPDEVWYVLDDSGAEVVIAEDREQIGKLMEIRPRLPRLRHAVLLDGKVKIEDFLVSWKRLEERGAKRLADAPGCVTALLEQVGHDDPATFVYTSGTTGRPKGVVLTQRNLVFESVALRSVLDAGPRDETLLFLPMAHIFARVGYLGFLELGYTVCFAESIDRLMGNLPEVKPTFVFSVPRIYEKVYDKIVSGVQKGSRLKRWIFAYSMAIGRVVSRRQQAGRWIPPWIDICFQVAEMLVFNKLRKAFGGEVRFFISGGAPLPREIAEFFHAAGMTILEGYGLTETTAASHVNRLDAYRFGTVGPLLPGVECRIASDGEILLRGPNVFSGYHQRPEATAEALVDGWFHTGDIGEIDSDGKLRITDRKKDIIVTSAGKNIAPQNIENHMKTDPFISQFVVYGDKRNYLVALVTLDPDQAREYAEHKGLEDEGVDLEDHGALCAHPVIIAKLRRIIEEKNKALASYETIKKFVIVESDFEVGEELTPTLKVRRKVVTEKYWDQLDGLYA